MRIHDKLKIVYGAENDWKGKELMCSDKEYPMAAKTPAVVMAGDFTVKAGWTLGPRRLNDYELVYFPIGSDTQYRLADGRSYKLDEPCFVLTCPEQEHTYIFDEKKPTRHLFIHFVMQGSAPETGGGPFAGLPSYSPYLPVMCVPLLPSLMKHILHLTAFKPGGWRRRTSAHLNSILAEWDTLPPISAEALPDAPGTEANGAFHEARLRAFSAISREPGLPAEALPLQIAQALQYIDRHLHRPLSIPAIAEHTGWTHEHFTRMFSRHLGMTPQ